MLIPQYLVLVLKLTLINTVSIRTVFFIPQNHCNPGTPCVAEAVRNHIHFRILIIKIFVL